VVNVGSKGINLAANAVVTAAVKGQAVVSDRLKSYSVMDLSTIPENADIHRQPAPCKYFLCGRLFLLKCTCLTSRDINMLVKIPHPTDHKPSYNKHTRLTSESCSLGFSLVD